MSVLSLTEHTEWLHKGSSFIGHTVCKGILSCVVAGICHEFPEADGLYPGFKLADL